METIVEEMEQSRLARMEVEGGGILVGRVTRVEERGWLLLLLLLLLPRRLLPNLLHREGQERQHPWEQDLFDSNLLL